MEAQGGALECLYSVYQWSKVRIALMRSMFRIRIKVKSRIQIRIEVKRWIRIRIEVMRISNPF
jgi:hypothetical protein